MKRYMFTLNAIRLLLKDALPDCKLEQRSEGALLYSFEIQSSHTNGITETPYQLQIEKNGRITLFCRMVEATEEQINKIHEILYKQAKKKDGRKPLNI